jgi:hypothetical protein
VIAVVCLVFTVAVWVAFAAFVRLWTRHELWHRIGPNKQPIFAIRYPDPDREEPTS